MPGYSVSAGGGGPSGADSTGGSGFSSPFIVNNGTQGLNLTPGAGLAIAAVVGAGVLLWIRTR